MSELEFLCNLWPGDWFYRQDPNVAYLVVFFTDMGVLVAEEHTGRAFVFCDSEPVHVVRKGAKGDPDCSHGSDLESGDERGGDAEGTEGG